MRTEDPASTVHPRTATATAEGGDTVRRDPGCDARSEVARPEPRAETDDHTPEEAGYGYGV